MNRRRVGTLYERSAGVYLLKQGYEILEFNYRCRAGEIDIIAKENGYLVFVEVKFRRGTGCGDPLEAVDKYKQRTISRVAMHYCQTHALTGHTSCRFDVVAVRGEEMQVVKNAFEYCGYR